MNTRVLDLLISEESSKLPALRCVVSGSLSVASSVEIGNTFPSGLQYSQLTGLWITHLHFRYLCIHLPGWRAKEEHPGNISPRN